MSEDAEPQRRVIWLYEGELLACLFLEPFPRRCKKWRKVLSLQLLDTNNR